MLRSFARITALVVTAITATSCCTAFNTACDCVSCLISGPRLPFATASDVAVGEVAPAEATSTSAPMQY